MPRDPRRVYLDYHATTPLDERVLGEMLPYLTERFGNASSRGHIYGWEAASAVTVARERVARSIGAKGLREIVFTSGATESNNLALKGTAALHEGRPGHVLVSSIEHSAVMGPADRLARQGFRLSTVPVGADGVLDPESVVRHLQADTFLVSVMLVNNEIGTVQPIEEIGRVTRERGITLHCDAAQALGRVPIDVDRMNIDLLSLSAHKVCGPKGCGALYVRSRRPKARLLPLFEGGRQERSLRSGTLDVPSIVGFGAACELLHHGSVEENERVTRLRDRLLELLRAGLSGVRLNGDSSRRVGANLNVSFDGVDSGRLLAALPDVALSNGAACAGAEEEPSRVLAALGLDDARIRGAVRFGLGRFTTQMDIEYAAQRLIEVVERQRSEALLPATS